MSRHQFHVATLFLHTMGFPGRDAKLQVATSHTATHVATSKLMSRLQIISAPSLLRRDTIFPCRDLKSNWPKFQVAKVGTFCNPTRSRRHFLVATSRPTKPGRDLITMSQPQKVLTHQIIINIFLNHPVAFLPATPLMQ